MSINKEMLYRKVERQLLKQKHSLNFDLLLVLYLLQVTIFNNPVENCVVKGKRSDWKGLPNSKSLFHAESGLGLPIGNLTSQLFGNVYLNAFDHFVKRELKIKYYGRYVDDFILIHSNKAFLVNLIPIIRKYLKKELELTLHPNKIYLQHYSKGVKYLGAVIKPHRIYIANRTKGNFYESIQKHNVIARDHKPSKKERKEFASCMNSYLGIMQHYKTYNIRKTMVNKEVSGWWWNYLTIQNNYRKYQLKS